MTKTLDYEVEGVTFDLNLYIVGDDDTTMCMTLENIPALERDSAALDERLDAYVEKLGSIMPAGAPYRRMTRDEIALYIAQQEGDDD